MAQWLALRVLLFLALLIHLGPTLAQNTQSSQQSQSSTDAAPESRSTPSPSTLKTSASSTPTADVFTATVQSFPTAPFLTTVTSATVPLPTSIFTYYPLYRNETSESLAITINTAAEEVVNLCWYPLSGNYGLLPRILFYITIVAALLLRHHQWLYAGALVAALTYSGSAAIHACLLVWRGSGYGELDGVALLSILGTSCIITVPLLNWSSTLRNIGKNLNEENMPLKKGKLDHQNDTQFDVASRTIVLYWGFLVMVGFLCMFVALPVLFWSPNDIHNWQLVNLGGVRAISCSPPGGKLNLSAGQASDWSALYLTSEFIEANQCGDPCAFPDPAFGSVIFRSNSDLSTLNLRQMDRLVAGTETKRQASNTEFIYVYLKIAICALPYILLEGFWAALFGRRTPAQIRNLLYSAFTRFRFSKTRSALDPAGPFQRSSAMFLALLGYSWAIFILVLSVPLFVLNLVALELFLYELPQSEANDHVGAWSPWASVGLALLAAFFARFHGDIEYLVLLSSYKIAWLSAHPSWLFLQLFSSESRYGEVKAKNIFTGDLEKMPDRHLYRDTSKNVWARTYGKSSQWARSKIVDSIRSLLSEWNQLVDFCLHPDFSRGNQGRIHRLNVKPCNCVVSCQCSPNHVQGDCRHEKDCKPNNVCKHKSRCHHSNKCKRARRLGLLNPERMAVTMALTAFHGQNFQLDMAGTPIPLREEGQPIDNPTFVRPLFADTSYDPGRKASETSEDSTVPLPNWHQSRTPAQPQMPTQPARMLLSRFWTRNGTYDQVVEEKQAMEFHENYERRPSHLEVPNKLAFQAKGNSFADKPDNVVVSEEPIHPLLRDSFCSQPPDENANTARRTHAANLSVEESRRASMARPLPPTPLRPNLFPRTPHSTPNIETRSSASRTSGVSAMSPATQKGHSFDNIGESVSPEKGSSPERKDSDEDKPKGFQPKQPRNKIPVVEDDDTSKFRNSTGLASSFEEGIMQRQRRSRAYGSDLSPNWHMRPHLTHSATAPIPVHTEEGFYDDDEAGDTFSVDRTASDFAGSVPPTHFVDDGASDGESPATATPHGSPRRSFSSGAPEPPSIQLYSNDPAMEPIAPSGEFLTAIERHLLLDPPSGASTPPIQLPPLSPADPASNTARAGAVSLLMRSPHLSLGSALATPNRVMSMASRLSEADPTFGSSSASAGVQNSRSSAADGNVSSTIHEAPESSERRSTVSYLQVQRPNTMMFADEITLRKDEMGVYRLVMNGREVVDLR